MRGGQKPIHIQRWAPQDFTNDPIVRLQLARRDYEALSFYVLVLNHSFMEGGDLPADPEALAAIIGMPVDVVKRVLPIFLNCEKPKLVVEETCLFNPRVRREIRNELRYRAEKKRLGKRGGEASARKRKVKQLVDHVVDQVVDGSSSPPAPTPAPSPAPLPTPPPVAARADAAMALKAAVEATGRPADELLFEASRVRKGGPTITRIDLCDSESWLRVTAQKLTAMVFDAQSLARAAPDLPTPEQWAAQRGRRA